MSSQRTFHVMSEEHPQRFTPDGNQVIVLARREAVRLNHNFIGTEHVFLGLVALGHGRAHTLLQKVGLEPESVCLEIEKRIGTGANRQEGKSLPYTERVKRAVSLAAREAEGLDVDTDHVLLGLAQEIDGVAAQVLRDFDVDADLLRQELEHDRANEAR